MSWFSFSLLSVTALAIAELVQQHFQNSKRHIQESVGMVLLVFFEALLVLPLILVLGLSAEFLSPVSSSNLPYLFIVDAVAVIAIIFYLKSFRVKNISISGIFISISTVVSTLIGIVFFHETVTFYKFLGIGLILFAIISLNLKNTQLEKNHLYGLIAGLLFGIAYSLDKKIVLGSHPVTYMFWTFMLAAIMGTLINPKALLNTVQTIKLPELKPVLISAIGYTFYNFCTFTAYAIGGEVGRIDAINNSQIFIIILVEYFLFKHKEGILRKTVTAIIAFIGVLILGNF